MRLSLFEDQNSAPSPPSTGPIGVRVLLEIRRGVARHKLRAVTGPVFLVGRSEDCDLVLADRRFPEFHAYLLVKGDAVSLRRLGDGPEITVDGRPVEAVELLDGDRLRTGPYEFRLHIGPPPGRPGDQKTAPTTRRSTRPMRAEHETPLQIVQALLADVRAAVETSDTPQESGMSVASGVRRGAA